MTKPVATEIPKEVFESLRNAGIGSKYHLRSLSEFGELGSGLTMWLNSHEVTKEVSTGGGRSIYGNGVLAHDVFMVLARGVHVRGL